MARILVVDDEPDIVSVVGSILKKSGHSIIGAASGEEALKKLENLKPDLILLDVMMPRLDGWETLRLIREEERLKSIPVAMLTVKPLTPEIIMGRDVGELVDYIQKPIKKEMLIRSVNTILEHLLKIAEKKALVSAELRDRETAIMYEIAARKERLHESMSSTLKDLLKETDNPEEAEGIKDAIASQERAMELFRSWREELEGRLGEKKRGRNASKN